MGGLTVDEKAGRTARRLRAIAKNWAHDPEKAHQYADDELVALLRERGYGDVVDAWDTVPKYYA